MTELAEIFAELGISNYLEAFVENGFDTWETILDITESDLGNLNVKLGHRRKLQRKIANSRGLSSDRALSSPRHTPSDDRSPDEQKVGPVKTESKEGSGVSQGAKRKYRRHPKPDENAPERPPSAYVIFSNEMREKLKGRNLSFTEIAKLVGEHWQNLSANDKDPYEKEASNAKEIYNQQLSEYKKTDSYKEYSQYLAEFKARQSTNQQSLEVETAKRPKLEAQVSGTASSGTVGTGASQYGGEASTTRMRLDSGGSSTMQWHPNSQPSPQLQVVPRGLPVFAPVPQRPTSSHESSTPPAVLPGYRDAMTTSHSGTPQILSWSDAQRDGSIGSHQHQQLPRLTDIDDRRPNYPSGSGTENRTLAAQIAHPRTCASQIHAPPLLHSESTNRSSTSSASTSSTPFYTPRTPMEPPLERALPLPSLFPQKSTFDNQLPPLIRPSSLSPQSTVILNPQQSPNGMHPLPRQPIRDYGGPTAPPFAHNEQTDARVRNYIAATTVEEHTILDPVSALLKAGEIVNRNSWERSGT